MGRRWQALLCMLLIVVVLASCGRSSVVRRERGVPPPPVPESRPVPTSGEVVVVRGDTLYGIAFRHGLDYREVARWNGIRAPYTIYPGQRIRLEPGRAVAAAPPSPAPGRPTSPATTRPAVATPSEAPAPRQEDSPAAAPPAAGGRAPQWHWPAEGQLVGRFAAGDPTRQGIDIAGSSGQEVRAAADGTVVYSGAGLVGYGELVIIKHTDEWLSAYGHNRRRLVQEGQGVRAGEQIAEMGRSGASRDMLHFEIRRNGRPVDPLQHLPRR